MLLPNLHCQRFAELVDRLKAVPLNHHLHRVQAIFRKGIYEYNFCNVHVFTIRQKKFTCKCDQSLRSEQQHAQPSI